MEGRIYEEGKKDNVKGVRGICAEKNSWKEKRMKRRGRRKERKKWGRKIMRELRKK